jgi:hypothetical protein
MRSGIYTAEMGQPPVDIDGASAGMDDKPVKKKPAAKPAMASKKPAMASKKPVAASKKPMASTKTPVKKYAKGGSIDGCAIKGKTKGRMM